MDYKDITPEQMKKLDACETPEDILALAKEEGVDLSDEDIEKITGGRGIHGKNVMRGPGLWD